MFHSLLQISLPPAMLNRLSTSRKCERISEADILKSVSNHPSIVPAIKYSEIIEMDNLNHSSPVDETMPIIIENHTADE